jgi:hypothetical protein
MSSLYVYGLAGVYVTQHIYTYVSLVLTSYFFWIY